MELRLDQLLQLLRRERGEFWVSSQQLWDSIDHANKQVSIEQEWFDVRVAEQSLLPEFCVDNKQGILFRKQGRYSDLGHSTVYILHRIYNPVDDISFYKQYIISTTRKDSISSTLKPGRGLREPSMDRGSKVGNLTLYTFDMWFVFSQKRKSTKLNHINESLLFAPNSN